MDDGHNDTGNVKLETPSPQTRKRGRPRKPPMIGPHNAETPKGKRGRPPKIVAANGSTPKSEVQSSQRKRGRPPKQPKLESHEKRTQSLPRKRGRPPKSNIHMPQILHFLTNSRPLTVPTGDATLSNAAAAAAEESSPIDDMEMRERIETPITVKRRGRPPKQTFLGLGTLNIGGEDPGNKRKEILIAKDRLLLDGNKGLSGRHGLRRYNSQLGSPGSTSMPLMQVDENFRSAPFMDSVVKVFCVHTEPNFSLPWQRKRQFSSTSSGFIISGRRLLTNAHSVEHHTQVKVKKRGSDTKFLATVLAFGTECDIALLTVNDDEFWEGVTPVEFGALPNLQDAVTVVGYPIGGDTISVTSGVVSRIEVTSYVHGATELLGVQIDAAINAGNSGGPAFNDKVQCVGIAFQSLKHEDAENIGYVIPTPVITHFIQDYARTGDYTGFPTLGIEWQNMENPDLRKALGMASNQKGVRVRRVEPTAPSAAVLQSSDILLSFDGIDIANDGTVPFRNGERIGFSYLVSQKYTGEKATIQILRKGKSLKFDIELETQKRLVPVHIKGKPPPYYIVAGVVFAAVSVPYLRSEYGKDYDCDSPVKLLDKLLHSMAQTEDEQLVLVSQVLVADINIGYEEIVNTQVIAFNGVPVRNLKHLANMVETCKEEFLRFNLEYEQILVLETEKAKTATPEILATHCIPSAMSDDLKS